MLDGQQKEIYIDRKFEEMDVLVVDDCYGFVEKNGLIYMLYYGDVVIVVFDEMVVR